MHLTATTQYLNERGVRHSRKVAPGTLIMSICATVGAPVVVGIDACIHDGFVMFTDLREVDRDYLFHYIKFIESSLSSLGQTGSQSNLNTSIVSQIEVVLPPLDEQHAIAEALGDVDTLLLGLDQLIGKKRAVKQAVMEQLLTGRRIARHLPYAPLRDVAFLNPGVAAIELDSTIHYVALEDVRNGQISSISTLDGAAAPSRARRATQAGDVIIGMVRPSADSVALVPASPRDLIVSTGFTVARPNPQFVDSRFIYHALSSSLVQAQVQARVSGSNYPAISPTDCGGLTIPLPPLPEQQAIAEVLTALDDELRALDERRGKTQHLKRGMMASLLSGKVRLR